MKHVVVTGSSGLLGTDVAEDFAKNGWRVTGVDKQPALRNGEVFDFRLADFTEPGALQTVLSQIDEPVIVHTGAVATLQAANANPYHCGLVNVYGTLLAFEAALRCGSKVVVFVSSDKAIGCTEDPADESSPLVMPPACLYSRTKTTSECIAAAYGKLMTVIVVRPCNMYGKDLNTSRIIPRSILLILEGKRPQIYEGQVGFREYIAARDVASAIRRLVEWGYHQPNGTYYFNCGSGERLRPTEIAGMLLRFVGRNAEDYEIVPAPADRGSEYLNQWLDSTALNRTLSDWSPRPLRSALPELMEFYARLAGVESYRELAVS